MILGASRKSMDGAEIESHDILQHPASQASVYTVLQASELDPDGRSEWLWVRLPNGDLILGVYPQGDTYFACEEDSTTNTPR